MTNPVSSPTAEPSKATSIATENAGTSAETPGLASANSHVQIEAYWLERKKYLQELKNIPGLKIRYAKALAIYLLRRLLWSFAFFPIFIAFWVPFVLSRFNLVAMVSEWLPTLQNFVQSDPQAQAATMETLVVAWFSIGFIFAVFDMVLTPFKSPYEHEADVHMRAWETLEMRKQ